jgi:hypothetical protein
MVNVPGERKYPVNVVWASDTAFIFESAPHLSRVLHERVVMRSLVHFKGDQLAGTFDARPTTYAGRTITGSFDAVRSGRSGRRIAGAAALALVAKLREPELRPPLLLLGLDPPVRRRIGLAEL